MIERHEKILEILKDRGRVSVSELARILYVCDMTVRRDLRTLEAEGRIKRYNGGAMLFASDEDFSFSDRKLLHSKEKMRLAKTAAQYVTDHSSVFIDSSSSAIYVIPHLREKRDIRIVTNSISALVLSVKYNIPCIIAGGECYGKDMCTVGSFTTDMLEGINIDIAFFSSNAVSEDGLITDDDAAQTAVRRCVMRHASRSVFIFTKAKKNKKAMYTLCNSDEVFKIISE